MKILIFAFLAVLGLPTAQAYEFRGQEIVDGFPAGWADFGQVDTSCESDRCFSRTWHKNLSTGEITSCSVIRYFGTTCMGDWQMTCGGSLAYTADGRSIMYVHDHVPADGPNGRCPSRP